MASAATPGMTWSCASYVLAMHACVIACAQRDDVELCVIRFGHACMRYCVCTEGCSENFLILGTIL